MPHRSHLFSLRIAHAFRETCLVEPYDRSRLVKDLLAGLTIGVIAVPLSIALAIASGAPPQSGLYTAAIAGFTIALAGGSRFNVSGPTAAFVVVLYPIVQTHGLRGLFIASLMSGLILIAMGVLRLGRFIEYIPEAVTLGFTCGIALVIAALQIPDYFGLASGDASGGPLGKVLLLFRSLSGVHLPSVAVATLTLVTMFLWPKLKTKVPPHLPAVLLGTALAAWLAFQGFEVETIGSRFTYLRPDGTSASGIPPYLPSFSWPWLAPGPSGSSEPFTWALVPQLFPQALAIALLGAIESLLCAVVLDGMSGKRHSANSELLGQGVGNIVTPFLGGITATAALARSAANYRAGAESPVASAIHGLVVLSSVAFLAPVLAYLPMPTIAALLMAVAWNMSEIPKVIHLIKHSRRTDIIILFTCFFLTVVFDMVVSVTVGVLLAAVLFMNEIASLTTLTDVTESPEIAEQEVPKGFRVYRVNGPLFFAAADRVFGELAYATTSAAGIILQLDAVPLLDGGGTSALNKLLEQLKGQGTNLILTGVQAQPEKTLRRARVAPVPGELEFAPTLRSALAALRAHDA